MENNDIKIFCCTHIDTVAFDDPLYELLHTGQAYDKQIFKGINGDDSGDNISKKKDIYDGLLTGMYWIWKNTNYSYKGICSYRGYLGYENRILSLEDAKKIFFEKKYDIVAARIEVNNIVKKEFEYSCNSFYCNYLHNPLAYTEKIIANKYPKMIEAYQYCMNHKLINHRHTFICKQELFDEYAEWVFDFIDEYINYSNKINYHIGYRFFGYLVERLERVWILFKGIKVLELPIVYLCDRNESKI